MLVSLSETKKKPFTWKLSARGQEKGVVDGIGSTTKSLVRRRMLRKDGGTNVVDTKSFAQLARKLTTNINVVYIPQEQMKAYTPSGSFQNVPQ